MEQVECAKNALAAAVNYQGADDGTKVFPEAIRTVELYEPILEMAKTYPMPPPPTKEDNGLFGSSARTVKGKVHKVDASRVLIKPVLQIAEQVRQAVGEAYFVPSPMFSTPTPKDMWIISHTETDIFALTPITNEAVVVHFIPHGPEQRTAFYDGFVKGIQTHRPVAEYRNLLNNHANTKTVLLNRGDVLTLAKGMPYRLETKEPGLVQTVEFSPEAHDKRWADALGSGIVQFRHFLKNGNELGGVQIPRFEGGTELTCVTKPALLSDVPFLFKTPHPSITPGGSVPPSLPSVMSRYEQLMERIKHLDPRVWNTSNETNTRAYVEQNEWNASKNQGFKNVLATLEKNVSIAEAEMKKIDQVHAIHAEFNELMSELTDLRPKAEISRKSLLKKYNALCDRKGKYVSEAEKVEELLVKLRDLNSKVNGMDVGGDDEPEEEEAEEAAAAAMQTPAASVAPVTPCILEGEASFKAFVEEYMPKCQVFAARAQTPGESTAYIAQFQIFYDMLKVVHSRLASRILTEYDVAPIKVAATKLEQMKLPPPPKRSASSLLKMGSGEKVTCGENVDDGCNEIRFNFCNGYCSECFIQKLGEQRDECITLSNRLIKHADHEAVDDVTTKLDESAVKIKELSVRLDNAFVKLQKRESKPLAKDVHDCITAMNAICSKYDLNDISDNDSEDSLDKKVKVVRDDEPISYNSSAESYEDDSSGSVIQSANSKRSREEDEEENSMYVLADKIMHMQDKIKVDIVHTQLRNLYLQGEVAKPQIEAELERLSKIKVLHGFKLKMKGSPIPAREYRTLFLTEQDMAEAMELVHSQSPNFEFEAFVREI
jgi:hypothetical protein